MADAGNTIDNRITGMAVANIGFAALSVGLAASDVLIYNGPIALNAAAVVAAAGFGYEAFRNIRDKALDGRGYMVAAAALIPSGLIEAASGLAGLSQQDAENSREAVGSITLGGWKAAYGLEALVCSGTFGPKAREIYSAIGSRAAALLKQ